MKIKSTKYLNSVFLIVILILFPLCKDKSFLEENKYYCIGNNVRVRNDSSLSSKQIGILSENDEVVVVKISKNKTSITINNKNYIKPWYYVKQKKKKIEGWVYSLFISKNYFKVPKQFYGIDKNFEKAFSFCPFGWSSDGKLGFMEYRNFVYAEESSQPKFYIYDTIKQEFVFRKIGKNNLSNKWEPYKFEIHEQMSKFHITPNIGVLKTLPIVINNKKIDITSKIISLNNNTIKHTFYLKTHKKTTLVKKIIRKGDSACHNLYKKILISPFENKGVVLVSYCAEVGRDFDLIGVELK